MAQDTSKIERYTQALIAKLNIPMPLRCGTGTLHLSDEAKKRIPAFVKTRLERSKYSPLDTPDWREKVRREKAYDHAKQGLIDALHSDSPEHRYIGAHLCHAASEVMGSTREAQTTR